MTIAQQRAVESYRQRQRRRGLLRLEVQASEADAPLLRRLARVLRKSSEEASELRRVLRRALAARGESAPRSRARDFSSDQGAELQGYWWYLEIRERRAGGKDPLWARSDFRHGLLAPEAPEGTLKELLEAAPLEGVDLSRRRDLGREVEL